MLIFSDCYSTKIELLQEFWTWISSVAGRLPQAGIWQHGKRRGQCSSNKTWTHNCFWQINKLGWSKCLLYFCFCTSHCIFKVRGQTWPACCKRKLRFLVFYGDKLRQSQKAYCNTILLKKAQRINLAHYNLYLIINIVIHSARPFAKSVEHFYM